MNAGSQPLPAVDPPVVETSARQELDALQIRGVRRGMERAPASTAWQLSAFSGRFAEVSGNLSSAALTLVFRLVLEAQKRQEPVVWIARRDGVFFPPDVARAGIDLDALPVIWAPDTIRAARAADQLLRSSAFGLVVIDFGADARMPIHVQTRLAGLAKKHESALICITEKEDRRPSLGSLVSLRAQAERTERVGRRYRCEVRILKDKRRGPGWKHGEVCGGPDGLC